MITGISRLVFLAAEFQQLWRKVQHHARQCAEEQLAPLILASNAEEKAIIQDILGVLDIANSS
jgi:hypothetical protein